LQFTIRYKLNYCKFYEIMKYASVYVAIINVVW